MLFFFFTTTLFHIYLQRKNYKNCKKLEKKSNKITVYRVASLNNSYFVFYVEIMTDNKIKIETKNESYLTFCLRDLFYFQPT